MKRLNKAILVHATAFLLLCVLWVLFMFPLNAFEQPTPTGNTIAYITWISGFVILSVLGFSTFTIFKKLLTESRFQRQNFFENNPTPMAIVDPVTLQFLAVNQAGIICYGYSQEEFLASAVHMLRLEDEDLICDRFITTEGHGLPLERLRRHRKKNGEIIIAEVSESNIFFEGKDCKLLLARDITDLVNAKEEKKLAQEESIKQRDFTAYVLENFPVDVAIFDKDHKYLLLNKIAVKNDEIRKWLIGKDDFDYFKMKGMDPAIAETRRERFNKALIGETVEWIDEHLINGEQKFVLRKFYPYNQNGCLKYVYGYGMDITEVKKAQVQKDEYIGQLEKIAFDTSHKIRQPICNIQGLISLLKRDEFEEKEFQNIINCMQTSVVALDDYTKELAIKLHRYQQQLKQLNEKDRQHVVLNYK